MINKYTTPLFLTLISLMNLPAYAGFERAKTMMEKVQSGLSMLALCTVGVAVIFVGYKIIFGGCTIREMMPVIIGAGVIGSFAEIASLLVG